MTFHETSATTTYSMPPDWREPEEVEDGWRCWRSDNRRESYGRTKEEAIAGAWREHKRLDLGSIACTLWLESGMPGGRNHGYVVLWCESGMDDGERVWGADIIEIIGANAQDLDALRAGDADGCYGIAGKLPACVQCEVLCAIKHDRGDHYNDVCVYLEIVELGPTPAVEVVSNG